MAVPSSADYFETLGIRLLRGRRFDTNDDRGAAAVVVINEAMANLYWQDGGDPLNDRIHLGGTVVPEAADEPARQIIGIVANVRHKGIFAEPEPTPTTSSYSRPSRPCRRPSAWQPFACRRCARRASIRPRRYGPRSAATGRLRSKIRWANIGPRPQQSLSPGVPP